MNTSPVLTRLAFHVYTTRYLAGVDFLNGLSARVAALPDTMRPRICQNSRWKSERRLTAASAGALLRTLAVDQPEDGDVTFRTESGSFEMHVLWRRRTSESFASQLPPPFNTAGFTWSPSEDALRNPGLVQLLVSLWLDLCESAHATYGHAALESPLRSEDPRGFGSCLPRLYWQTYLGTEYAAVLNTAALETKGYVRHLERGCVVMVSERPQYQRKPGEQERLLMRQLGQDYFWDDNDSWRKPKKRYLMPDLDWSEVAPPE